MYLPTVIITQEQFDVLPLSESGDFDQARCRYHSSTGQWILIDKEISHGAAVIEIEGETKLRFGPDVEAAKRRVAEASVKEKRWDLSPRKGPRHTKPKRRR